MGLLLLVLGAGLHPLTEPLPGPDSPSTAWVALKLKAEHPSWSYVKVKSETEKLLERFPTRACFEKRHARAP